MSWPKFWHGARLSLVALCVFVVACQRSSPAEKAAEKAREHEPAAAASASPGEHESLPQRVKVSAEVIRGAGIKLERAGKAQLSAMLELPGEVGADPDRLARLSAPAGGRIEQVRFREGDKVKKGDALLVIRVPEIAKVHAAQLSAQARAKAARANATRARTLVNERLATDQEALNAEAEADSFELEARANAEQLGALGATGGAFLLTLRAPISGTVVARDAVVGQPASVDQTLGTIADLAQVWFLARVFEKDLGRLRVGAVAEVHMNAYADEHFSGTVEYIGQQIDPVARTVKARVRLDNPNGLLRLGLFGTCQIATDQAPNGEARLVVARAAVTELGGKTVVFVRESESEFELHPVTLGRESLGRVEVLEGLREGEEVVSDGVFTLKSLVLKGSFAEED